jgi:TRAP-type C4-dicarboxylate transport system substrate-binding protein
MQALPEFSADKPGRATPARPRTVRNAMIMHRPALGLAALLVAAPALADTFILRIGAGHPSAPTVYVDDFEQFFVPEVKRRVAERTGRTVNFVEGYGGSMAGVADTLEAVEAGLLDIGAFCMCFEPAKLFLHSFPYFTPFGPQDSEQQMQAVRAVYDQEPFLTEVFEKQYGQKLLGLHGWDNYRLGATMPRSSADLRGVKIAGAGPILPWLEFAGAVPVQSALPDGYLAFRTGVCNGWVMFPSAYCGFKFFEPAPHFTLIGFGAIGVNALTVNLRTWNRLPEAVRDIIAEVAREYEANAGTNLNAKQAAGLAGLRAAGAKITEISPEVRAEWAAPMAPFAALQAREADSRGLPGPSVMRAYIAAVDALGYEWPQPYVLD